VSEPPLQVSAQPLQARGQPGETRSIGLSIVLAIITLGIYPIYWAYKTHEEMKRYSGNGVGGVIGLVIYLVVGIVTFFIVPSEVRYLYEELDGSHSPVRGTTGLWVLLPLVGPIVWFVKVQGALNRYWESKGVAAT
jgi:membrane protein YdbS with pleckstrin-like domain